MRTIWGIVIFSLLTVFFNCILLYCYIQGQRAAKKTKRAITESHTNAAASTITASEEQITEKTPPESNNNKSSKKVEIDIEKQESLPSVPEETKTDDEMKPEPPPVAVMPN
jgi:hypothetical protein